MTRVGRGGERRDLELRLYTTESWVEGGLPGWGSSEARDGCMLLILEA